MGSSSRKVAIVGGGFAGLSAARVLRSAPVDATVVDRRNCHLFRPLLDKVATGSLSAGEVAAPLRGILGRQRPLPPFAYFDKGTMAGFGRGSAVANIFGLHVSGLPAWLVWAFIHVLYLVQFESRVFVFMKWAVQALTFNRSARLITSAAATDFDFSAVNAASVPDVRPIAEARR